MSIQFTVKNVKFPGALKAYTEKQLRSIERIGGDIINAEVIVNQERIDYRVEIALKTKLFTYHAEESDQILKQALRKALNTLKSLARKNKDKLKMERKRASKHSKRRFLGRQAPPPPLAPEDEKVTISDNFSAKPYSLEEAIIFLKESGENAYMFVHSETSKIAVVFYNKDNGLSIIEAK